VREVSLSEFRRLTVKEIKASLPLKVTADGQLIAYIVNLDDVIVINDLHPRVKTRLQMMERQARRGMPKSEKLTKATVDVQ